MSGWLSKLWAKEGQEDGITKGYQKLFIVFFFFKKKDNYEALMLQYGLGKNTLTC